MKVALIERTLSYLDKMETKLNYSETGHAEKHMLRSSLKLIRECDINDVELEMHLDHVNDLHNLDDALTQDTTDVQTILNILKALRTR